MKETVQIVIPAGATERTEYDLVELTEYIANNVPETTNCGGGLGGEFGYGIEYENDTFMMHPFCWCEKENCKWCWGDEPNFLYKPTKTKIWWYKWIGRDQEQKGSLPINWLEVCIKSIEESKLKVKE